MSLLQDISGLAGLPSLAFVALAFLLTKQFEQFFQLAIALAALYVVAFPVRTIWFRDRPKKEHYVAGNLLQKYSANSLLSVHTARATILAFVLAAFFNQFLISILFAALILAVAASRFLLKKHHISDIFTGFLVGAGVSLLVLVVI